MRIRFPTVAKRLALLLVVVLAGDRALAWMLARAVSRAGTRFARAYRGGVDADVLVAGDSRGVNGLYGPAIRDATGLSAFNLAYNGLSTHLCEALVLDYLERNRAPRLLLVEASNVRSPDEMLESLRLHWRDSARLDALAAALIPRERRATRILNLYGYDNELALRSLFYAGRDDQDWVNRYRISPAVLEAARREAPFRLEARPDNLEALGRLVRAAEAKDITVRVVLTPYLPDHLAKMQNWPEFVRSVEQVVAPRRVWDYSDVIADPSLFADRLHLNADGARRLARKMAADGLFALAPAGSTQIAGPPPAENARVAGTTTPGCDRGARCSAALRPGT